jgi:hypothetical protein
MLAAGAPALR